MEFNIKYSYVEIKNKINTEYSKHKDILEKTANQKSTQFILDALFERLYDYGYVNVFIVGEDDAYAQLKPDFLYYANTIQINETKLTKSDFFLAFAVLQQLGFKVVEDGLHGANGPGGKGGYLITL